MSTMASSATNDTAERCQRLRSEIKNWEKAFAAANGRKASQDDLKKQSEIGLYLKTTRSILTPIASLLTIVQRKSRKNTTSSRPGSQIKTHSPPLPLPPSPLPLHPRSANHPRHIRRRPLLLAAGDSPQSQSTLQPWTPTTRHAPLLARPSHNVRSSGPHPKRTA